VSNNPKRLQSFEANTIADRSQRNRTFDSFNEQRFMRPSKPAAPYKINHLRRLLPPHPKPAKALSWHCPLELVTFRAVERSMSIGAVQWPAQPIYFRNA
jgi:hypothetical protein